VIGMPGIAPPASSPRRLPRRTSNALRRGVDRARWSPSAEDTQPWWWVLLPDRLELRLDRSRCVDHDPTGLVALAGAGAALCTAEVGAAAVGVAVDVQVLPDPADEALVAVLRPGGQVPDPRLAALDPVVELRHTCREGLVSEDLPWDLAADLTGAAAAHGVQLMVLPQELADRSTQWAGDAAALCPALHGTRRTGAAELARAPARIALVTAGDTASDRVQAGRALQRVLLEATRHGRTGGPVTGPVEVPAVRARAEQELCPGRRLQALVRVGRGTPGPLPGPRRPMVDVLHDHTETWEVPPLHRDPDAGLAR
jgi:nitroreductase